MTEHVDFGKGRLLSHIGSFLGIYVQFQGFIFWAGPQKFSRRALITDVLKLDGDASVIQLNVAGCHFGVSFYRWRDFGVGWLGGDYGSINPFHIRF